MIVLLACPCLFNFLLSGFCLVNAEPQRAFCPTARNLNDLNNFHAMSATMGSNVPLTTTFVPRNYCSSFNTFPVCDDNITIYT